MAGAVPAARVLVVFTWRRRVDWISVMPVLGFAVALAVTALSDGASLPLKLYRPVGSGAIGFALLISVVTKRPLVVSLARYFASKNPETSGELQRASDTPAGHRKFTVVMGFAAVGDSVAHIVMALTLPTVTFLVMSRVVTVLEIAILLGARWVVGHTAGRR